MTYNVFGGTLNLAQLNIITKRYKSKLKDLHYSGIGLQVRRIFERVTLFWNSKAMVRLRQSTKYYSWIQIH